MSQTIYISRKCEHCHELLILLHKHKDILKFPIVDIHRNPYPKIVTSVPCMVIDDKVLPGQELFKFLNYLLEKNQNNQNDTKNDLMRNNNPDKQNNPMQNPIPGSRQNMQENMQNNVPGDMKNLNVPGNVGSDSMSDRGTGNSVDNDNDGDLPGFCIGGSCDLGFCNIDNEEDITMDNSYEMLNESDSISPQIDQGSSRNEKSKEMDDDYSRLMKERGNDMNPN